MCTRVRRAEGEERLGHVSLPGVADAGRRGPDSHDAATVAELDGGVPAALVAVVDGLNDLTADCLESARPQPRQ